MTVGKFAHKFLGGIALILAVSLIGGAALEGAAEVALWLSRRQVAGGPGFDAANGSGRGMPYVAGIGAQQVVAWL